MDSVASPPAHAVNSAGGAGDDIIFAAGGFQDAAAGRVYGAPPNSSQCSAPVLLALLVHHLHGSAPSQPPAQVVTGMT